MLTLLPLSGIQDAFKRRNSTTMEQFADRRGSISVYDTYSLPNSKEDMRRFSSYEQLAPFFQQILSQENGGSKVPAAPAPAPTPVSPTTASTSGSGSGSPTTISPSPLVRARRGSITRFTSALTGSFRRQKSILNSKSVSESESAVVSCEELDAKLAEIKGKLAQFKSEDTDMSQRVEELSNSVEELYASTPECCSPLAGSQDRLYYQLRQQKMQQQQQIHCSNIHRQPSLSTSGLQSISENMSYGREEEPDDVLVVRLRRSSPIQRSRPSSYASISEEPEPTDSPTTPSPDTNTKSHCLLNNTFRPESKSRTKSLSQLPQLIRNDLSRRGHSADASSKRNSVISIMSDSVLLTHRHLPAMQSLLKEHEF